MKSVSLSATASPSRCSSHHATKGIEHGWIYLYPDEDWMTAPQDGDPPDTIDAPPPWAWDEDPEPDYEHEYRQRKAEADTDWEAWELGVQLAPHL